MLLLPVDYFFSVMLRIGVEFQAFLLQLFAKSSLVLLNLNFYLIYVYVIGQMAVVFRINSAIL